ncbi:hypothetical protein CR513_15157, partial [Mucuna pruriens]
MYVKTPSWYADLVNYLASKSMPLLPRLVLKSCMLVSIDLVCSRTLKTLSLLMTKKSITFVVVDKEGKDSDFDVDGDVLLTEKQFSKLLKKS